ncbi:hypothetical protein BSZ35_00015 [Salinibacter sp. 10B]|uniref:5-methylcytosine-specific restriction endonuclease system specificity protein McrC n=1 Tax=Salinibacter sp. 10B TaxID=1923971 RepID=UPI000CF3FC7B|nr:5-methylcytosine-specific restriction endonuclease system specificity protein McrC [Salinibacter sp. 10B]PQJ36775.1 hypothetical protein BSZ35_00015 [Salinibacter sp. 10B]
MSQIPIENVYYLLCYAWGQMREGEIAETGASKQTELVDLFAKVLINGTERVLKQGLDRGYVTQSEDTSRPRGRIDFDTSLKRALLPRARVHCQYDTLSRDVLHNRILKSTLGDLAQVESIDEDLRRKLLTLQRRFGEVSDVPLRRSLFRRVQLHSNNAFYRFLLNICSLVERNLDLTEEGEGRQFRDFLRDKATMSTVFEDFVLNFYDREQEVYDVSSPYISWDVEGKPPDRLPRMETDVVLTSSDRTIVIDTKFYENPLVSNWEQKRYRSEHLYQLFSYLQNAETKGRRWKDAKGILLYAATDTDLDEKAFEVRGHKMQAHSIDLDQKWWKIHDDLLTLVNIST